MPIVSTEWVYQAWWEVTQNGKEGNQQQENNAMTRISQKLSVNSIQAQCEWSQFSKKKTYISRIDQETRSNGMLYTRRTCNQKKGKFIDSKNQKPMFHAMKTWKQTGISKLFLDKVNFKPKLIRSIEMDFMLGKRTIQDDEIIIINRYAPNNYVLNFMKQTLLDIKDQIKISAILVGGHCHKLTDELDKKTTRKYQSWMKHLHKWT